MICVTFQARFLKIQFSDSGHFCTQLLYTFKHTLSFNTRSNKYLKQTILIFYTRVCKQILLFTLISVVIDTIETNNTVCKYSQFRKPVAGLEENKLVYGINARLINKRVNS